LPDSPVLCPFFLLFFFSKGATRLLEKDQKLHHSAAKGIPSLPFFLHNTQVTRDLGFGLHSGVWSHPSCHARRWLTTQIVLPWPWLEPCPALSGQKLASCPLPTPPPWHRIRKSLRPQSTLLSPTRSAYIPCPHNDAVCFSCSTLRSGSERSPQRRARRYARPTAGHDLTTSRPHYNPGML
jgi:hypothetical protein